MTYASDCTLPSDLLEHISSQGFEFLPELIRILVNAAMQAERQRHLQVAPYERSQECQGHANGYKPKTLQTRLGEITFDVPQVREGGFYPQGSCGRRAVVRDRHLFFSGQPGDRLAG